MKIEIFEPAMCCSTGICGANVDPELLRISTLVDQLSTKGVDIKRYNLSSNPEEFVLNPRVQSLIQNGTDFLPLTLIDGEVFKQEAYPSDLELLEVVG